MLSEYIYILQFSYFLFYKLILKPQVYLNCINTKLWLQACFLKILNFYTFLSSFLSCFLHIFTARAITSLIASFISILAGQDRLRAMWWEPEKNELQGHEWGMVALVTQHECFVVGSPFPALRGPTTLRFAVTMEDTLASRIWVELISYFQMEILISVPWAVMQM